MFGEFIKERRTKQGISLREFSRRIDTDPSNWSKTERGLLSPPRDPAMLKRIAKVLGIKVSSEAWTEMKDKAHIDAGRIPQDLLSDSELVQSLPLLFRTLRDEKPTPEELDRLLVRLRKGN
jgi:transcriptional regulator with XRE-family HTH domain